MSEEIIGQLRDAIAELDADKATNAAKKGIKEGLGPLDMINEGIRTALDVLGERFSSGELFDAVNFKEVQ